MPGICGKLPIAALGWTATRMLTTAGLTEL